jgi:DNA recombination protein RmuC
MQLTPLTAVSLLLVGLAVGAMAAWWAARLLHAARLDRVRAELQAELRAAEAGRAARDEELAAARQQLRESFAALSGEALRANGTDFLRLARAELERLQEQERAAAAERERAVRELLAPVQERLSRTDGRMEELERERAAAFGMVAERLRQVEAASQQLSGEAQALSRALRAPDVRGRWGEVQLERVVELAGMVEHCDFTLQPTLDGDRGRQRPDLTVKLPGGRTVVVDAKTPLAAYLEAMDAPEGDGRSAKLRQHAAQVRARVTELSRKQYWAQFEQSPEFVVLFLPGEVFFSAALQHEPALLEDAARDGVMLVTPTSLIALLRAVDYGWRQEGLARHAQDISRLGRELYDRLFTLAGHVGDVGRHLDRAVASYNGAVGALESRVLVSARRLRELDGGAAPEMPELPPVDRGARELRYAERAE